MKQTLLTITVIIILFLCYTMRIEPIRGSIDSIIKNVSSTRSDVEEKYASTCPVQMKGTIDHENCEE